MAVLLVNNYVREAKSKIKRYIESLRMLTDEEIRLLRFYDVKSELELKKDIKAIILSGSEAYLSKFEDRLFFEGVLAFIRKTDVPLLGICFGHQLIALAFGAEVVSMRRALTEPKEVVVEEPDEIFASWQKGDKLLVAERHSDEVAELPEGFVRLASSDYCPIEAMKHVERPVYGVQFHPERRPADWPSDEPWHGLYVLYNFLDLSGVTARRPKPL